MDAWRTSCPKLPVWEDTLDAGLIERRNELVFITDAGIDWLSAHSRYVGH
jgi:D-3-phosphoglycerate dehydrogenase